MKKVKYGIHHQAAVDCPECGLTSVEDLGEFDDADGIEIDCPNPDCETTFELEGKEY